jgi:hypothetical protein
LQKRSLKPQEEPELEKGVGQHSYLLEIHDFLAISLRQL